MSAHCPPLLTCEPDAESFDVFDWACTPFVRFKAGDQMPRKPLLQESPRRESPRRNCVKAAPSPPRRATSPHIVRTSLTEGLASDAAEECVAKLTAAQAPSPSPAPPASVLPLKRQESTAEERIEWAGRPGAAAAGARAASGWGSHAALAELGAAYARKRLCSEPQSKQPIAEASDLSLAQRLVARRVWPEELGRDQACGREVHIRSYPTSGDLRPSQTSGTPRERMGGK